MQTAASRLLKSKRLERGVSQAKLARALGHGNPQFISNIERGLCRLPVSAAKKVCKILEISTDEMLVKLTTDMQSELIRKWNSK